MVSTVAPKMSRSSGALRSRRGARAAQPAGLATHLLAATLLLAGMLFLAWVRVGTLHLGYELGRLRSQQDALLQERAALTLELQTQRMPSRLSAVARGALGMVPAQQATTVGAAAGGEAP